MAENFDCKHEPGQVYVLMQISTTDGEACCLGVFLKKEEALKVGYKKEGELVRENKWMYGIEVFAVHLGKEYAFQEIYGIDLSGGVGDSS